MVRRLAFLAVVPAVVLVSGCSLGTAEPATYVTDTSATLNAEVSSNQGGEVLYWFEWGTTTEYGNVTPDRSLTFPEGHTSDDPRVQVSEPIAGLEPDTTYHYRACSSPGAEEGSRGCTNLDQTFTTDPAGSGRSGIAFSSDRTGDEEVWVMDEDGGNPTNLTDDPDADATPAWSPDGASLAFSSTRDGIHEIYAMGADGGNQTNLTNDPAQDIEPAWSPDGGRIAFESEREGNMDVFVMDADGGGQTNLTDDPAVDLHPAWSPEGGRLAFDSDRDGNQEIYVMDADGGNPTRLTNNSAQEVFPDWSPDGSKIAFNSTRDGNQEIYVMNADGSDPVRLTNSPAFDGYPDWSPDGSKIAFHSFRDGNYEIYVMDADGGNPTRITNDPGHDQFPAWSPRPEVTALPTLYVSTGDSVATEGDPVRYPERFFSYLDQAGAADDLENIAVGGATSGSLMGSQLTTARQLIDDSATDTTVVTIDIGGNDILTQPSCNPPSPSFNLTSCQPTLAQFSTNLTFILDSLNTSLDDDPGSEQLIAMAYYNPWSGDGPPSVAENAERVLLGADRTLDCDGSGEDLGLNDRIACIGSDHQAKLADAYPPFVGHGAIGDYFADDIHPNGAGHQAIADIFEAAFETSAAGDPKATTYISDTGATLNGDVYSSFVETEFWWRYGETTAYGSETPHRTVDMTSTGDPQPVSQPIGGLAAETTYHFEFCVQDQEVDPPREVCSSDQTFTTATAGGRSGIAFVSTRDGISSEIFVMDADGSNQTNLTNSAAGERDPTWSPDGKQIAFGSTRDGGDVDIFVMGADGTDPTNLTNNSQDEFYPAWSPDGTKIAFSLVSGGSLEIFVMDADGSNPVNLTNSTGGNANPAWSPDGSQIAFNSNRDGAYKLYVMDADGSDQTLLSIGQNPSWSPDRTRIAVDYFFAGGGALTDIVVMNSDGSNHTRLTTDSNEDEEPSWAPDAGQITFGSDRVARPFGRVHVDDVFTMNADGSNQTNRTVAFPATTDEQPAWSPRP